MPAAQPGVSLGNLFRGHCHLLLLITFFGKIPPMTKSMTTTINAEQRSPRRCLIPSAPFVLLLLPSIFPILSRICLCSFFSKLFAAPSTLLLDLAIIRPASRSFVITRTGPTRIGCYRRTKTDRTLLHPSTKSEVHSSPPHPHVR